MKLLVLSDSHGDLAGMRLALRRERPDQVLHLGDHAQDAFELAQEFSTTPIAYVRGNCDGPFPRCADTFLRKLAGVQVFAAHGHRYCAFPTQRGKRARRWRCSATRTARTAGRKTAFGWSTPAPVGGHTARMQ